MKGSLLTTCTQQGRTVLDTARTISGRLEGLWVDNGFQSSGKRALPMETVSSQGTLATRSEQTSSSWRIQEPCEHLQVVVGSAEVSALRPDHLMWPVADVEGPKSQRIISWAVAQRERLQTHKAFRQHTRAQRLLGTPLLIYDTCRVLVSMA